VSSREIGFYKLSPGGNTTILVMDAEGVAPAERAPMAARLMDPLHLGAEQVGYISAVAPGAAGRGAALARLDMMGGEFCGNAARSLAAVLALEGRLDGTGSISVSGAKGDLPVRARRVAEGVVDAWAAMPVRPGADCVRSLGPGLAAVALDGITHLLIDEGRHPWPTDSATETMRLLARHGLDAGDAAGCIWHRVAASGPAIRPVVWVRATGTTHQETACGSGTMALAQALALEAGGPVAVDVTQPSGAAIGARVVWDPARGEFSDAWIGGPVRLVARGSAFV
jgi:diaminopimelate epimerase